MLQRVGFDLGVEIVAQALGFKTVPAELQLGEAALRTIAVAYAAILFILVIFSLLLNKVKKQISSLLVKNRSHSPKEAILAPLTFLPPMAMTLIFVRYACR